MGPEGREESHYPWVVIPKHAAMLAHNLHTWMCQRARLHAGLGPEKPSKRNANQPSTYLELHRNKACPGAGDQSVLYPSMTENSVGLSRFRNSQVQRVIIKKKNIQFGFVLRINIETE